MIEDAIVARARTWRHDLHRCPELAFTEQETAAYLAEILSGFDGVEVATGIGGTGVVGSLRSGRGTRSVALRSDIDCLPLAEVADRPVVSRNEGRMHACGHDGHMAMVLGAAAELSRNRGFDGTVQFVFQPAEEPGKGARAMIEDGLFTRFPADAVYGLHNVPGLPAGELHTCAGPIMAGEDNFQITIRGRGGHASAPELLIDPILIQAEIIQALQTIVSRSVPAQDSAVVSCTEVVTEGARNAVPSVVIIRGDTRSYTQDVRDIIERDIRRIAEGICTAHGATCEVTYTYEFDPTVNTDECARIAHGAAAKVVGAGRANGTATPIMASEDFGLFAREVPGCFAFIGNGTEVGRGGTPLHSRDYEFNDEILPTGIDYYATLVRSVLSAS